MVQRLPIEVTANVGIAVAPDHGTEAETLLRRADIAMHAARKVGGTVVEVYSPEIEPHDPSPLALRGALRNAIEGNQLQLYFQPKVGLKTNTVMGAEALLRWPHPKRGFIPPSEFIPLAENAGLNGALTRWVLDHAVAEARAWYKAGKKIEIAVNVSARSLQDRRIVEDVMSSLERSGLEPVRLIVEVTESAMMHDPRRAAEILGDIRKGGVNVSIDDFGTGFTSFNMLKQLDLTELKIDNSFVRGMQADGEESSTDTAIVRATADLAHNLDITAVAEGVEDEWTLDLLANFGCDQAQGYHIARPMPGSAFVEWLGKTSWKTVAN
jgi:EAL domain-containing protein (putative c-di-GMP-specific phosphodiesterase class I)